MLLLRKVILAEAMMAIWAAAKSFVIAFMTAPGGINSTLAQV
jgi:hypothetical protein